MTYRPQGEQFRPATLVDLLRHRATVQAGKLAYIFLKEEKGEEIQRTYAELDAQARQIAAHLQSLDAAGQRILLLFPPGIDYIAAFFGCLYAGAVAVPAYPPRPNKPLPRIQAIVADCDAHIALTTASVFHDAERHVAQTPNLAALRWVSIEELPAGLEDSWRPPAIDASQLAFLQYTSGSTGNPKGVMVSHGNLVHNLEVIRQGFQIDPSGMGVTWLPMYHDMGLIGGILSPMYVGGPATLMSPVSFLQRPVSWLQAITRYRGTISGAPNFAYQLCVDKITPEQRETLDLSTWETAFTGAEPIRAETLERFAEAFAPCGFRREAFYPCFGLAEGTLMVTGGHGAAAPTVYSVNRNALGSNMVEPAPRGEAESQTFVGCGNALLDQRVLIVDLETGVACPTDRVGEIWAAGQSMAQGYWNRPEETRHTFEARLASGDGPFMRTGDLGFFHQGQLYVAGRLKDLIIIRGRNHYPQDVERTVEACHPALRADCGAAFAIEVDGEEQLVIVQEVEREHRKPNVEEIVGAIRRAVAQHHDVQVYAVALVRTMTIPKTSSGKIQRRQCRTEFLEGTLSLVGEWRLGDGQSTVGGPASASGTGETSKALAIESIGAVSNGVVRTADEIAQWLVGEIANRLKVPRGQIDLREPFERYGMDSLAAVTLAGDLERWLGRSLPATLVYEFPNIDALANHLAGTQASGLIASGAKRPADANQPIAIIGLGCRFPGADNPDAFWRVLHEGLDCITEVPKDRWDVDALYDPDVAAPGKMSTRWGGFLREVDRFDPQFFGIAPREAVSMDPQQRLFLEVSWEALENAGQPPDKLAGSLTGVFMGICGSDYSHLLHASGDTSRIDAYYGTGSAFSVAAGRASYVLGLQGPNFPVDTACSSSLVAVHLAVQSLRQGECRMALAGGVNLLLSPEAMIYFSKVQAMSPDGRCKTFDASANGYVRGEGCGVVVLKRLSDALADGDQVLAVIRGTAINHDGRSNGLTAPNGAAQEVVIRNALAAGGVSPGEVGYVEAHGTGTSLGDPIEVRALGAVLAEGREANRPAMLGSVKTNIGHLEAAAGVAGLIKVVLSLQHEEVPPHLHFKQINPHIPLEKLPLTIPTQRTPWKRGEKRRIAGVSSFGFSGTNAHIVLEEAPETSAPYYQRERPLHVMSLSAKTPKALLALVERYEQHLAEHPDLPLADAAFTANSGRAHFAHRMAMVAADLPQLRERLSACRGDSSSLPAGVYRGQTAGHTARPKIAFLFTGQGSQYAGMGRELYETQPVFRRALEECDRLLREIAAQNQAPSDEPSLLSVLYPSQDNPRGTSALDETRWTQPALFAFEYALATLWRSWGIEPTALLGHSVGEYVAACLAGVFTLEEGLRLIYHRARLMQSLPAGGQMAALFAPASRVEAAIAPYADRVSIAAYNGPQNVVISGEGEAVQEILAQLAAEGIRATPLLVSHAFHSPLMEPILAPFEELAGHVKLQPPQIRLVSNLTGKLAEKDLLTSPGYWSRHIRSAVQFERGIQTLVEQGYELFVEIGPSPTLLGMARRCLREEPRPMAWLASLRQGRGDWQQLLESLAQLYVRGVEVDWRGFDAGYPRRRVLLPNYPFQRERYWLETSTKSMAASRRKPSEQAHPLVGQRLRSPLKDVLFEAGLSISQPSYLADHRVYGTAVLPAAAYLEMALAAGRLANKQASSTSPALEQVSILEPLVLSEAEQTVQVIVSPADEAGRASFQIASLNEATETWRVHARGTIVSPSPRLAASRTALPHSNGQAHAKGDATDANTLNLAQIEARLSERISASAYYQRLHEQGLEYGALFQGIVELRRREGEALGELQLPAPLVEDLKAYQLHPALVDAAFQLLGAALPAQASTERSALVPVAVERVEVVSPLPGDGRLLCHVALRSMSPPENRMVGDLELLDSRGHVLARITGLTLARLPRELLVRQGGSQAEDWLYELAWQAQEPRSAESATSMSTAVGQWLLFADGGTLSQRLSEQLELRGETCRLVRTGSEYRALDAATYQINPHAPADFQKLLAEALDPALPLRGVVYLWPLAKDDNDFASTAGLLHLVQALASRSAASSKPRLWLVTRGAVAVEPQEDVSLTQSPLWGLARVAALEHPDLQCVRIDLPADINGDAAEALFGELWAPDREDQIAYRAGQRHVARLKASRLEQSPQERFARSLASGQPLRLEVPKRGVLDNLELVPQARRAPGRGEVEIEVVATGLNFRDVLNVLGLYPGDPGPLGGECAGRIAAVGPEVTHLAVGDEVLGIASGSFANYVTTPAALVAKKPKSLSFEEAATIPITFLTAHYALNHLAGLKAGDRVLIQAASGGVGLAAVQLAQRAGAEIFGTAGSPAKHEYLHSLGVTNTYSSRTLEFAEQLREATAGAGVRVVLNSLAGEFIPKGLSLVSPGGHFLEIGKADIWDNARVAAVNPQARYTAIALDQMVLEDPQFVGAMLGELMPLFESGELRPLRHEVFPLADAVSAFRHMAQARHIGKIVVRVTEQEQPPSLSATSHRAGGLLAVSRIRPDASYLITGGLGALGLHVARWLVEQGACSVVLVGRRAPSEAAARNIAELEAAGARVLVVQADISQAADVANVLARIEQSQLPALRGVIHAAGVLDDGVLAQQSWERFERVFAPKVAGAWHLHHQTRDLPLDFFVLFSSIASLLGSPGQGNYAAANAYLDALAAYRHANELPALSINWGPWADSGMAAAQSERDQRRWAAQGITPIPTAQGLDLLGKLLASTVPQTAVLPVDWKQWVRGYPQASELPLYAEVLRGVAATQVDRRHREAILAVEPGERLGRLQEYLQEQVCRILQISKDKLDVHQPLKTVGLDSLMAIELKNLVESSLAVEIPAVKLLEGPTLVQLAAEIGQQLGAVVHEAAMGDAQTRTDRGPVAKITDMATPAPANWISFREPRPDPRIRLFCFHFLGGGASAFQSWQEDLPDEIEVCPIQLPGREDRIGEAPREDLVGIAGDLARQLQSYLDRPFAIYGHSMGTLLGFEFARQVRSQYGLQPEMLFVGGYFAPHMPGPFQTHKHWADEDLLSAIRRLLDAPDAVLQNSEFMQALLPTIKADLKLVGGYEYVEEPPLDCPIWAFGGQFDDEVNKEDLAHWQQHTASEFRLQMFPGRHLFVLSNRDLLLAAIRHQLMERTLREMSQAVS